jgi:hypothetical protein
MEKEVIITGESKELESPKNLKIRIPSPKIEEYDIEEKSKLKKYNLITYLLYCVYCYPNEDY